MAPDNTLSVAPLPNFELASDIAGVDPLPANTTFSAANGYECHCEEHNH